MSNLRCHSRQYQKMAHAFGRAYLKKLTSNGTVLDQVGTLSQVGTKKISKGGWTILELSEPNRNHYLSFRSQSD